jgi:hypothetical protein
MLQVKLLVLVGQVRVVEQVTLEEKLCGFEHRPLKLYPIGMYRGSIIRTRRRYGVLVWVMCAQ